MKHTSIQKQNYNRHREHNKHVAEFHKNHAYQVENGLNGNSWLAKWETFFYKNFLSLFKR